MTRALLIAGAREFNAGRYFEAHEILEDGLDEVDDADWDLVLGLIQIAVGYHKASQRRWSGALLMLEKGLEKVAPYPDGSATLQLEELRARVAADAARIAAGDCQAVSPPRLRFT